MSVTTSSRLNADQLQAQLPGGATFTIASPSGTPQDYLRAGLPNPTAKTLTVTGATDAQLQTAITSAAAAFVDYAANRATLLTQARNALANNATYLGIGAPTNAQVVAQVQALTRQVNGLIRFAVNDLTATT